MNFMVCLFVCLFVFFLLLLLLLDLQLERGRRVMFVSHDSYISNNQCIWGMGFRSLDMGTIFGIVYPDLYKITHFHYKY